MVLQIIIEVTDSYISLIFKFQQNKIANIANFVYYGKTRLTIPAVIFSITEQYNLLIKTILRSIVENFGW